MKFIVAHPDTQHSGHTAVALKRAGMLRYYLTSLSLRRHETFANAIRSFAPNAYARAMQHRSHSAFAPEEIRTFPLRFAAMKLGEWGHYASLRAFAWNAGRLSCRDGCGLVAFNSAAMEAFRMMEGKGLPRVLDQTIAHCRWSNRVGQAECDANPEWMDWWAISERETRREEEEAATADMVLCGSDFCAGTMVEQGVERRKIRVVPYGTDSRMFVPRRSPRSDDGTIRLLFVGSLALRKGIHYLLDAARAVKSLGVRVTLVGASRVSLEHLHTYKDVADHQARVLHGNMASLYQGHDIFVFPSLVEGSSLSVYEAMSCGLPTIVTPNAGSMVRDGVSGLIVPPRDVGALAAAIERLAKDRDERIQMGIRARGEIEHRGDWSHYGDRLVAALSQMPGLNGG